MDGKDLDREIESLLAVEPSPEFVARVRTRVVEGTPRGSWVGWQLTLAVASLGLTVIVAIALWPSKEAVSPGSEQARLLERMSPQPRTVEPERVASGAVVESPRTRRTGPAPRATDVVAAERPVPVVNEEDGKAFDEFVATIRDRRVVLTFNESPDSALAASPLVIAPIAIDPLPDVLEGGVE